MILIAYKIYLNFDCLTDTKVNTIQIRFHEQFIHLNNVSS